MKTAMTLGPRPRMSLPSLTAQYLSRFHRLVSHELASLRAGGEPIPGELTAKDVVAATLCRDYRELVKDPARREIGSWLIGASSRSSRWTARISCANTPTGRLP